MNYRPNNKGMSLIEILVVLLIIAMVSTLAINSLTNRNNDLKKSIYQFSAVGRVIQNKAKLFNTTYRLVVDLGDDLREEQLYWVEKANSGGAVFVGESPVEQQIKKISEGETNEKEAPLKTPFQLDTSIFKEPKKVLKGLKITDIETIKNQEPFTEGFVYIYFLPQGLVDQSAIHFQTDDAKNNWTLTFHPLTAKGSVTGSFVQLKDIYEQ